MLKPSRKILRKEIKKDPLLDTFEKIEHGFEKNRKTFINILIISAILFGGGLVFLNNQNKNEFEAISGLNIAMVAYANKDYDNAKFQFESISSTYKGTEGEILAKYYLGKIAHEKKDFNEAKNYLHAFLELSNNSLLVCGAVKMLVDITFQNENYLKSFEIIESAKKFKLNSIADLELKLLKTSTLIKANNFQGAQNEIDNLLKNKNLPPYFRDKIDEFLGML